MARSRRRSTRSKHQPVHVAERHIQYGIDQSRLPHRTRVKPSMKSAPSKKWWDDQRDAYRTKSTQLLANQLQQRTPSRKFHDATLRRGNARLKENYPNETICDKKYQRRRVLMAKSGGKGIRAPGPYKKRDGVKCK